MKISCIKNKKQLQILVNDEVWKEVYYAYFKNLIVDLLKCTDFSSLEKTFIDLEVKAAKEAALYLLSLRSHFNKELQTKLHQRYFSPEAITAAMEYCLKLGYLNDKDYQERAVARELKKGYGPQRVKQKLSRFLKEEDLDRTLYVHHDLHKEQLRRLLEKYSKAVNFSDFKERQKLIAKLCRRGFSMEDILTELSF